MCAAIFVLMNAAIILSVLLLVKFIFGHRGIIDALEFLSPLSALGVCFVSMMITAKIGIDLLIYVYLKYRKISEKEVVEVLSAELVRQSFFHKHLNR